MTRSVLSCLTETGTCLIADSDPSAIALTVVTDPLCSACWAFEPVWRRFIHHHGTHLSLHHVYGVLLPNWDGFTDPGAGIGGPGDVPAHWQEVALHSGQPINVSVWDTDPVSSTIPAIVALLRLRTLAPGTEVAYLRRLRELVLAEGRNIARPVELAAAARDVGVGPDLADLIAIPPDEVALKAVGEERKRMESLGARSFPTLVLEGVGQRVMLTGSQSYSRLSRLLKGMTDSMSDADELVTLARRNLHDATIVALSAYTRATTREVAELLDVPDAKAESALMAVAERRTGTLLWTLRGEQPLIARDSE